MTARTVSIPAAPLSASARAVLRRLELAMLAPTEVVTAVTMYEEAAVQAAALAGVAESGCMSDLDADSLAAAEDLMAAARSTLAAAGQLHLIEAV
jgi:hypothetical protein